MPGRLSSPYPLAVVLTLGALCPLLASEPAPTPAVHVDVGAEPLPALTAHARAAEAPVGTRRTSPQAPALADGRGRNLGLIMGMLVGVGLWLSRRRLGD